MVQIVKFVRSWFIIVCAVVTYVVYTVEGQHTFCKYNIYNGLVAENSTGELWTISAYQCAAFTSSSRNSLYPLATYNKTTSSCKTVDNVPRTIYLSNTGDENDIILMIDSNCTYFVHVFKTYDDTDYPGNDYTVPCARHTTIDSCVSYCQLVFDQFKAIMYEYGTTNTSGGQCCCKTITRQQHIDRGLAIRVLKGWNYYERLC